MKPDLSAIDAFMASSALLESQTRCQAAVERTLEYCAPSIDEGIIYDADVWVETGSLSTPLFDFREDQVEQLRQISHGRRYPCDHYGESCTSQNDPKEGFLEGYLPQVDAMDPHNLESIFEYQFQHIPVDGWVSNDSGGYTFQAIPWPTAASDLIDAYKKWREVRPFIRFFMWYWANIHDLQRGFEPLP